MGESASSSTGIRQNFSPTSPTLIAPILNERVAARAELESVPPSRRRMKEAMLLDDTLICEACDRRLQ